MGAFLIVLAVIFFGIALYMGFGGVMVGAEGGSSKPLYVWAIALLALAIFCLIIGIKKL